MSVNSECPRGWPTPRTINEESFRSLYSAPDYRVSIKVYEPGVRYPGTMRPGLAFVIHGACQYEFANVLYRIESGSKRVLPGGNYWFEVVGNCGVEVVNVWYIKDLLDSAKDAKST